MHDAVVIGAGHNGLAAAVHLAARGWKVAVIEQAVEPGGAVKTGEATLPGFRHDLYAMNLSLFAGSPFLAAYRDLLTEHGLAFASAADCFATAFPDRTWLGVSKDLEATARRIASVSRVDAQRWRTMATEFAAQAPHLFRLLSSPMPSWAALRGAWTAFRHQGGGWFGDTARMLVASPRAFLDGRFESDKLKAMMAVWGMHLDFPPDAAGGALFPYLEAMASQNYGMVIGKGGADTIIRAMTSFIASKGGELHCGVPAARIEVAGGRAQAVRLADGRVFAAHHAVIANVHPKLVFGRLIAGGSGKPGFDRRIGAFRAGPGTMMIHAALSGLPDWAAGEALQRFAYVHIAPDLDTMARAYSEAAGGLLPREPVLVVGQPTAIDPSRAPDGRHILWVQVRVLPAAIRGDAAGAIAGQSWDDVKEAYADRVMQLIERYAPGLGGKVLARTVLSPLDLERANPNLIGGDSLSGSHHLDQNFLFRPAPGWSRYRTPVAGLYMCGASTWPGAGVGAGSGFMLAQMLTR